MGKIQNSNGETTLKTLLFVDFFNAIKDNTPELIGVDEDRLEDLSSEYYRLTNRQTSNTNDVLRNLAIDISICEASIDILSHEYDGEIAELIRIFKIECYPDNVPQTIELLAKKHAELVMKFNVLKAEDVQPKSDDLTGEDVLAQLSVGLEMRLEFNKVTVLEYVSLSRALGKKNESIKKSIKKKK